jgi:hypothetical protein
MKAKKVFFSACLTATMFAGFVSCDKGNDPVNEVSESSNLRITTSWASETPTKAAITEFEPNDKLGLFITSGTLDQIYNQNTAYANVASLWDGTSWSQTVNIYLDNKEASIFAYYPYKSSSNNGKIIPVESASQTDYLFGKGLTKANIETPSTNVEMRHALTQVAFSLTTQDYSGVGLLQEVTISNTGAGNSFYTSGTMNCETGIVTGTEFGTLTLSANNSLSAVPNVFSAIAMPVHTPTTEKSIMLTLKIDDVQYTYSFAPGTKWMPGTKNIYSICLKGKDIEIGGDPNYGQDGVLILPWNDVPTGEEIELTPVA